MRYLLLILLLPSLAVAMSDESIDVIAKNVVHSVGYVGIWFVLMIIWYVLTRVFSAVKNALPKVKDAAVQVTEKGVSAAQEFADRNKKCPFCAETIKKEAVVCHYCKRDLVP